MSIFLELTWLLVEKRQVEIEKAHMREVTSKERDLFFFHILFFKATSVHFYRVRAETWVELVGILQNVLK